MNIKLTLLDNQVPFNRLEIHFFYIRDLSAYLSYLNWAHLQNLAPVGPNDTYSIVLELIYLYEKKVLSCLFDFKV